MSRFTKLKGREFLYLIKLMLGFLYGNYRKKEENFLLVHRVKAIARIVAIDHARR